MPKLTLEHALDILREGDAPRVLNTDESDYILQCLERHPKANIKIGCGVKAVHLRDAKYGQRCFYVERSDGTETDFSIMKCFRPSMSKPEALFRKAARFEIQPPIRAGLVAHHKEPNTFEQIVQGFLRDTGINIATVGYDHSGLGVTFLDESLRERFREYHDARAEYDYLTEDDHHEHHYKAHHT